MGRGRRAAAVSDHGKASSMKRIVFLLLCVASAWAAETPRRGGTLHLLMASDWRNLDPAIAYDSESTPLDKLLFRGLLDYGDGNDVVPSQASDWNVSADGKTYRFHLRPGVKFSHGREVEAADYVFSLERILDPKTGSPGQSLYLDIVGAPEFAAGKTPHVAGLLAPDRGTLVIELSRPCYIFRYLMTLGFAAALPREVVVRHGKDFQYHMEGSGPYRVAEWRRGARWRFERNPHYAGTDGWFDAVEIMIGGDAMLAAMMVERGEIDVCRAGAATRIRFQRDPRLRSWLHAVTPCNTCYLFLNTEMKPFDDARVLRAMNHAVDRRRLEKLMAGDAVGAEGVVPESMPWSNPGRPRYAFDPERARALLREAEMPDGFKTEMWYTMGRGLDERLAQGLQQDLRNVGITVELKPTAFAAYFDKAQTRRQVPCGLFGWYQDYPDPSTFLDTLLNGDRITEENCNNQAFYNNPEVNRRLNEASRIVDGDRRLQLFREAEDLAIRDAPWVTLYSDRLTVICHPRLRGDVPHPVWGWRYENMWLAE